MESLESRQMLSITTLDNLSSSENTGEKPQSKVFEYAGQWWTVMPNSSGAWVYRLDGTSWTPTQQISDNNNIHADVKVVGDLAHVLLFDGSSSQVATLEYDAVDNRFEPWALQPQVVDVGLSSGVETATLEVDSTGRMWIASDIGSNVEVRYSDGLYTDWSAPITVASGIKGDDISSIIAMPNDTIGVFWSNQNTDLFGFRVHQDGAAPNVWSADEMPASQSALNVGGGMADDHLHLAVASDGTLYAAVKTSYDKGGYPKIALLVRRPNGSWDPLYEVDGSGTRPVVVVDEAAGKLIVAYTSSEGGGSIYYRESPLGNIDLAPRQTLISGSVNNVTTTKYTSTDEIVFLASSKGVLFSFDTATQTVNQAPLVNAGPDRAVTLGDSATLDGTASDDGLPIGSLGISWTKVSGPGTVTFADSGAVDTSASFSEVGTYVLRLTANDSELTDSDEMTVTVSAAAPGNQPPTVSAGPDRSVELGSAAALDGTVSDDGLPNGSVNTTWTMVSGPGTVTFADSGAVDTSASFSTNGTYALRLTANDGELTTADEMTVTVTSPPVEDPPPDNSNDVEIAFQDGLFPYVNYAGTSDTKIYFKNATTNYGTATTIDIDGSPDIAGLLKWDVSAVPASGNVVSAAIELNVTNTTGDTYEVFALQRAWDELSATWQQFAAGQDWSGAGADGTGDHGTSSLGQVSLPSNGIQRIELNEAGIAAVQAWIDNPEMNYGIIIKNYAASDGFDISTREESDATLRPKLIVNYAADGEESPPANEAPLVSAGSDSAVELGNSAALDGTASDDGLPNGSLNTTWTMVSGPGTVTFADSGAVDTSASFSTNGTYVLRLTANDGDLTTADEMTVTVYEDLGTITQSQVNDLSNTGETWYRVQASQTGYLTAEALFSPAAGDVQLTLYDSNLQVVAAGAATASGSRVDLLASTGTEYFLRVAGTNGAVDLRLTNLVSQSGTTVNVAGTAGDDVFTFDAGSTHEISVNGVAYGFSSSAIATVKFDGAAGNDTITLTGTSGDETAALRSSSAIFSGAGWDVHADAIENVLVDAHGGSDSVYFYDSASDDRFIGRPTYAQMDGSGFYNYASGFAKVYAFSTAGGFDQAYLFDSSGDDRFDGTPDAALMRGENYEFYNYAKGFDRVYAYATSGGTDMARLYDSTGNDRFDGTPDAALMRGENFEFYNYARGFDRVYAYATAGGTDTARLYDSSGNDRFDGTPNAALMRGENYEFYNYAKGFERLFAYATAGGTDSARLFDSEGDDLLSAIDDYATIRSTDYYICAQGFADLLAISQLGGNDTSDIHAVDFVFSKIGDWDV